MLVVVVRWRGSKEEYETEERGGGRKEGGGVYSEDTGRIQCCTSGLQWVYIRGTVRVQ